MTQLTSRPPIKMMIDDIQETRVLVDSLLKTKHYQRLGTVKELNEPFHRAKSTENRRSKMG